MDFALLKYPVDPKRVYLAGHSCGAIAGWNYLGAKLGAQVAAAVLIAGDGRAAVNHRGCDLGQVPIWAFHGDFDGTVDPIGSVGPLNRLNACILPPPVDARLTIYPGVGHDSWSRTYDGSGDNDIYAWFLSHQNP